MTRFDSIVVGNDLVSEHWLAEQFPTAVAALRAGWKEREELGKVTPRSGLTALAGRFGAALVTAREHGDEARLRALHTAIREALALPGEETTWTGGRADTAVTAVVPGSPSGAPPLLVLQARDAATVEDLLDGEGAGHLLTPATVDGKPEPATARVISAAFLADEPPALVLVTAGAWLLLAERERWPEGRWLAVDLATACERRDTTARGELETIAALVSADALLPADDGSVPLLGLIADSVKHAVGVSKDLRNGIRESIELLASQVLRRRRARGLTDDGHGAGLAADLTRQCLRYLYRVLFLLYAEARPELGVLPVGTPEYAEGYGLDRLRELVLTDLTSESAEQGTHLYQSLGVLFRLVNDGYPPETLGPDGAADEQVPDDRGGLRFEALRADLFSSDATALIDQVGLGNGCLQDVLGRLLLSRKQRGRDRGFVSYAQLGINQLGAVYEGLMSYTGSIAGDHMVEVAKDGDPSKGSWVVPLKDTSGFAEEWFVTTTDPQTGEVRRVTYAPGDFVFRLSGRDRQRSASYYTPEVLTRCVVTHSLAELLTERDDRRRRAEPVGVRARARVGRVPGRGDQPARGGVPDPPPGRAGHADRPRAVPGRAAEGEGLPRPAQLLRGRPQRHRRRARRDHAVARLHAPRPARPLVRAAPAPRQLPHRRPARDLDPRPARQARLAHHRARPPDPWAPCCRPPRSTTSCSPPRAGARSPTPRRPRRAARRRRPRSRPGGVAWARCSARPN